MVTSERAALTNEDKMAWQIDRFRKNDPSHARYKPPKPTPYFYVTPYAVSINAWSTDA